VDDMLAQEPTRGWPLDPEGQHDRVRTGYYLGNLGFDAACLLGRQST
jgi:hypothetical protein